MKHVGKDPTEGSPPGRQNHHVNFADYIKYTPMKMEAGPRRVGVLHSLTVVDNFGGSKPPTAFSEGPGLTPENR